jgi:hypothetical protein
MPAIEAPSLAVTAVGDTSGSCFPPKCVSVPLDFTTTSQYTLNLKQLQDLNAFDVLLCMYIDNRANGQRLDVVLSGTLQTVSAPANTQGYYPVVCSNPPLITFTTTGGALVNAFLFNFNIQPGVWKP